VFKWVDKDRTGSGSDRVEHSAGLCLATLFKPFRVLRWVDDPVATAPGSVFVDPRL